MEDATLSRVTVFPVKSLDGTDLDRAEVVETGALGGDREYAMVDADGRYVNGKRERAVHRIRAAYDLVDGRARSVTLEAPSRKPVTARLDRAGGRSRLGEWLTDYFGYEAELRRNSAGGHPDDRDRSGPTVVGSATLREVASWFGGANGSEAIDPEGLCRRLRPNLVLDVAEPFAEDRLVAGYGEAVAFRVGDVRIRGVNPCQRCIVPARDPETGAEYEGFRGTFVRGRERTMPPWSGGERFDHLYRLMVNTAVPEREWGKRLSVGDPVSVEGTVTAEGG